MSAGIIRPTKSYLRPDKDWRKFCVGRKGSGGGGGTGTAVDLVITFDQGTLGNSFTPTDLVNATSATSAASGVWTVPLNTPVVDSGNDFTTLGTRRFKVNGVTIDEPSGSKILLANTNQDARLVRYTLDAGKDCAQASMGFGLYVTNEGTFNFYNWGEMTGTNGKYNALHMRDNGPMQVGCEDALSNIGTLITLGSGKYYWMTMLYDLTNTTIKLRVYDPATWTLVGSESSLSIAAQGYTNFKSFMLGRTDSHGVFGTASFWTEYAGLCLSTGVGATFPLLPV